MQSHLLSTDATVAGVISTVEKTEQMTRFVCPTLAIFPVRRERFSEEVQIQIVKFSVLS